MARPRRSLVLARKLAENPAARLDDRHENPYVLKNLCELADEKTNCGDRDGLRVARLCCRIGARLGTDEHRARSFARLATALRFGGRLDHAGQALEIALAASTPELKGDLLRRRASLELYRNDLEEALGDAEAALELATRSADRARALEVLGVVRHFLGDHRVAVDLLGRCLAETDPDAGTRYCNAIHNYATVLSHGTDDEVAGAVRLCATLRPRLKDRHKMQRAKLWWTEGLLHQRLGDDKAAWWSLDTARRSLVALGTAPEVAAIVADMARVSPEPFAVRHLCSEAEAVIAAPHPLRRPLASLAAAARDLIPEAAAALRTAAVRLAPCPAL